MPADPDRVRIRRESKGDTSREGPGGQIRPFALVSGGRVIALAIDGPCLTQEVLWPGVQT